MAAKPLTVKIVAPTTGLHKDLRQAGREIGRFTDRSNVQLRRWSRSGSAQVSGFSRGSVAQIQRFGRVTGRVSSTAARDLAALGRTFGTVGGLITAGVSAGLVKATKDFAVFDTSVRKIVAIIPDATSEMVSAVSDDIRGLSTALGIDTAEMASAYYDALSAGVPREDIVEFLTTAGKLAIADNSAIATSVDFLTSAANAFKIEFADAEVIADSAFATVREGKTTIDQLGRSYFNVAGISKDLNVAIHETNAAIATLTLTGTPTAVATTQIRQALIELDTEGSKAAKHLMEATGGSFRDMTTEGGTLADAIAALQQRSEDTGIELSQMFGSAEAKLAAGTLAADLTEFQQLTSDLGESAGTTEQAFGLMSEGIQQDWKRFVASLESIRTQVGEAVAKHFGEVLPMLTEMVTRVEQADIDDYFQRMKNTIDRDILPRLLRIRRILTDWFVSIRRTIESSGGLDDAFQDFIDGLEPFKVWYEGTWKPFVDDLETEWRVKMVLEGQAAFDDFIDDLTGPHTIKATLDADTTLQDFIDNVKTDWQIQAELVGDNIESIQDFLADLAAAAEAKIKLGLDPETSQEILDFIEGLTEGFTLDATFPEGSNIRVFLEGLSEGFDIKPTFTPPEGWDEWIGQLQPIDGFEIAPTFTPPEAWDDFLAEIQAEYGVDITARLSVDDTLQDFLDGLEGEWGITPVLEDTQAFQDFIDSLQADLVVSPVWQEGDFAALIEEIEAQLDIQATITADTTGIPDFILDFDPGGPPSVAEVVVDFAFSPEGLVAATGALLMIGGLLSGNMVMGFAGLAMIGGAGYTYVEDKQWFKNWIDRSVKPQLEGPILQVTGVGMSLLGVVSGDLALVADGLRRAGFEPPAGGGGSDNWIQEWASRTGGALKRLSELAAWGIMFYAVLNSPAVLMMGAGSMSTVLRVIGLSGLATSLSGADQENWFVETVNQMAAVGEKLLKLVGYGIMLVGVGFGRKGQYLNLVVKGAALASLSEIAALPLESGEGILGAILQLAENASAIVGIVGLGMILFGAFGGMKFGSSRELIIKGAFLYGMSLQISSGEGHWLSEWISHPAVKQITKAAGYGLIIFGAVKLNSGAVLAGMALAEITSMGDSEPSESWASYGAQIALSLAKSVGYALILWGVKTSNPAMIATGIGLAAVSVIGEYAEDIPGMTGEDNLDNQAASIVGPAVSWLPGIPVWVDPKRWDPVNTNPGTGLSWIERAARAKQLADEWDRLLGGAGLPTHPGMAMGGVVTRPTMALIGEAGPEAVIPLHRDTGRMGTNIIINGNIVLEGVQSPEEFADRMEEAGRRRFADDESFMSYLTQPAV